MAKVFEKTDYIKSQLILKMSSFFVKEFKLLGLLTIDRLVISNYVWFHCQQMDLYGSTTWTPKRAIYRDPIQTDSPQIPQVFCSTKSSPNSLIAPSFLPRQVTVTWRWDEEKPRFYSSSNNFWDKIILTLVFLKFNIWSLNRIQTLMKGKRVQIEN